MANHSHNWYDGTTTRESINDSLDNVDTNKLKENIHAIQETIIKYCDESIKKQAANGERVKAETKMGKKDMKKPVPLDLLVVQPYVPPTLFPGHLKKQKDNPYKTRETVCMIGIP
ncbi:hypothetical protein Tco_0374767 [Tanacetum coccineum]